MAASHSFNRRGGSGGSNVVTELVVIVSTYHFTRDSTGAENPTIHPINCTVQFKYSSTEFVAQSESNPEDPIERGIFHFDKHGISFPYDAFSALMRSPKLQEHIKQAGLLRKEDTKRIKDQQLTTVLNPDDPVYGVVTDDDDLEEEEEDRRERRGSKRGIRSSPEEEEEAEEFQGGGKRGRAVRKFYISDGAIKKFPPPPPVPIASTTRGGAAATARPNKEEITKRIEEAVAAVGGSQRK